jgi:hypothetical protein
MQAWHMPFAHEHAHLIAQPMLVISPQRTLVITPQRTLVITPQRTLVITRQRTLFITPGDQGAQHLGLRD